MNIDRISALFLLILGFGGTAFVLFQRIKISKKLFVAALWFIGVGLIAKGYMRFLAHDSTIEAAGRYPSAWWQNIFTGGLMVAIAIFSLRSPEK